ncbi:Mor transcription activator family protein [Filifactor villosus]|uniref:Mor transcription activator family protein n=1 Tax=Filifactor villosus TaxID=29374 RepID=A0ABV9QQM6_9FIRM
MSEWKKELKIEELDSPYFELAEKFGIEVALEIEQMWRGRQIYFPFLEHVCRENIKEKILEEYNGYNATELAVKYGYSERHIRRLCENKSVVLDGQLNLFNEDSRNK